MQPEYELTPELSDWECELFGSKNRNGFRNGLIYRPNKGNVPNIFVRWMMKICFACTWRKINDQQL
jgi:hypothetical protein